MGAFLGMAEGEMLDTKQGVSLGHDVLRGPGRIFDGPATLLKRE